jgi:hypothetical protein
MTSPRPAGRRWTLTDDDMLRKLLTSGMESKLAATQCRSNPVSGRGLLKTGIFQILARDYRLFRAGSGQIRSPETGCQFAKARHWRAFLRLLRVKSPGAGLVGWRSSADRARLHAISLLSGNLTGNFAILRHLETVWRKKALCRSHLSGNSLLELTGKLFRKTGIFDPITGNFICELVNPVYRKTDNRNFAKPPPRV